MNEQLKLKNQLCFPLYAVAKEVVRRYHHYLAPYKMTYTQYIAMMAPWEHRKLSVTELGKMLYLDSGTLTPMLKKMEQSGWICRIRCVDDKRKVLIGLTNEGDKLHDKMGEIPEKMSSCLTIENDEAMELHKLLHKLLTTFK